MKKVLSLILVIMAIAFPSFADESGNGSSLPITMETDILNNCEYLRHRAPMRIDIEAYYNTVSNSININYNGDVQGEVFLYLDDNIIGCDSSINTSFQISESGQYKIEIISENWMATGYLSI